MVWRTCKKPTFWEDDEIVEEPGSGPDSVLISVQRVRAERRRTNCGTQVVLEWRRYHVHHIGTRREWWETLRNVRRDKRTRAGVCDPGLPVPGAT